MGRMEKSLLLLFAFIASFYCQSVPVIDMNVVEVREDVPVGEFAFQIIANDADNDPLTYDITGPNAIYFDVNKVTGEVKIKRQLDREANDLVSINVVVNDGVYADETKLVYVTVKDANDNAPVFLDLPYNREVAEDSPVGSTLFTAKAIDADSGTASIVSYNIDEVVPNDGASLFSVSTKDGHVVLQDSLSYTDKSPFYQIRISASDGGGDLGDEYVFQSSTAIAFITIKDMPDLDPQFLNLPNIATIDENSNVGMSVFTVRARDPDTGVNDAILYSIENTNAPDLFQINENDGQITVKTVFDREELLDIGAVVELQIKARETKVNVHGVIASTVQDLQIAIGDVNDNGPDFYECKDGTCSMKTSFNGDVDENSSTGVAVTGLNIRVKDPDQGANSSFNLHVEGPDKEAFSVIPSSGVGDAVVQLTIKNPTAVDFEEKTVMSVEIVATDASAGFSSTATITININDVNDNFPEFEKEFFDIDVYEHCKDGTAVATITAIDKDALDDGKITYKLVPDSILTLFDVYEKNGSVYVKNGSLLDWEGINSYSPTLQARDSDGKIGSTVLVINIKDINDQKPEINREVYNEFVQEDQNLELQIQARDGDEPGTPNSQIQYRIEDNPLRSNFTIDLESGLLKNNGPLDREAIDPEMNGVIELKVIALDMGTPSLSSSATVSINVGDVNDNSPGYLDPDYTFKVKENETGILVGSVHAHDADQTDFNNRIVFNIVDGSFGSFILFSEPFSEGYRGNITVDPSIVLDYDKGYKTYTLKVEASDLGQKKAVTTVEVVVEDVNDTPPDFPTDMMLNVNENTSLPDALSTITGTDVDTNFSLQYELISSECQCSATRGPCPEEWFKVEKNGEVKANPDYVIDYEKCDQVFLTAIVVDIYTEKGRNSSEGVVSIIIEDINDNAPEFITLQEFYVVLLERVEKGSSVAKVYATDRDKGVNRKTDFKVLKVEYVSGDQTVPQDLFFTADSEVQEDSTGMFITDIRSQKSLASIQEGKYLVEVQACNPNAEVKLCSTSVIELLTVDRSFRVSLRFRSSVSEVNDNLPQIRGVLAGATKATVHIFNVFSESENQRADEITVLEAYFVFSNGTALGYDEVNKILNSEEVYSEYGVMLSQFGFTGISTTGGDQKEVKIEVFIMIGLVAALGIVLVVTTTSLVCIRRNYKRKLKASKAMNSASAVVIENQKGGPVVPGTNKYTKEGANPVLNMNIDTATDLGFDEDDSSTDRESLNSLDYNIDMTEKDTMPMKAIEEEDEEYENESLYIEPLGAALAQRERKRDSESPSLTFENPSVSTTDL
ncbi:cadherin-related family member 2-like [Xyrauchen texanus]|uniref:cadherin-related family member 2-like n=1 Tax=Xyrauchen texanus TaxID=154827 RepID=UPI0022424006|nr:cadherin-related family member 2-like [Xyrauchen texanus]